MNYQVVKECTVLSDEGKITFPESVRRLVEGGIELYYADLLASIKTYYSKNEAYTVNFSFASKREVSSIFSAEGVKGAIRQIQSGQINYQEFLRKIMDSGIISYMVFLTGKKAVYFGRYGEQHIEEFPKN